MKNKNIRPIKHADIPYVVDLLNTAYRGEMGWSNESEIVEGQRISPTQLTEYLEDSYFHLFVLEVEQHIVGCIGLTEHQNVIEIGTFAIQPSLQNQGFGRQLLDYAERYAREHCFLTVQMAVLNVRTELISYYQRRGYIHTGRIETYPMHANVGIPKVPLHLLVLEKPL